MGARPRSMILEATKVLGSFYCDAVETTVVINAPFICRAIFALVSPFMTQRQKNKMRVIGNIQDPAFLEELHATIAPEILPATLGGSAEPDFWGQRSSTVKPQAPAQVASPDFMSSWLSCCVA